jgi:hypothetical protein
MIIKPISILGNTYRELIKIDETKSRFNEDWLQKVIHYNPQSYPIENPLNSDLKIISLGREINSGAGYIDILLLTSDAELIVVETKLWRNPEKSRTVLAQILDYAKELCKWDYEDLNNAVISAQRDQKSAKTLSLKDIIVQEFSNQNLTDFLEILFQNIQKGIMNLSIIGDKISPNLLLLSDTLQTSPGLSFNLKLIEMKLFSYGEDIIMIPDLVGKTKEVIREVVKVQFEKEKPKIEVTYLETENTQSSRTKTNKATFISQCPIDVAQIIEPWLDKWQNQKELMIYWGVSGLSIRKLINGKWVTLIDIYPYAISMITQEMANNSNIPTDIYNNYIETILNIEELKSAYSSKKRYIKYNSLDTKDITLMIESTGKLIEEILEKK